MTLSLAMVLDALFGEPKWLWGRLPHPAVILGKAVSAADRWMNKGAARRLKGGLALAGLVVAALLAGLAIAALGGVVEALFAAILIAQRSLAEHVRAVAAGLRDSLNQGRRDVAMIVGRDTKDMDEPSVARAAIESAAENLSDGVIAPLFWFLLGGLPMMLAYKAINTADSMIGYRTPRHEAFGWASAKLDDLVNWAPARLTALLILATHGRLSAWPDVRAEAPRHRSPNAGWPESALARSLDIALSGPRAYGGEMRPFPFVNPGGRRHLAAPDIEAAVSALWRCWSLAFFVVIAVELLLR